MTNAPPPQTRSAAGRSGRPVLVIDGLTKRYRSAAAVDDLSFAVPAGQVVGLLGPNGAGKTTAMKMLLGLVRPTAGGATVLGADLRSPEFAHAVRRVGSLIEAPALYERLSARRNLELQAMALGLPAGRVRIDELLDLVDLADDKAGSYSLGMKQRLGIAVAMIGRPELVILDEPANGLDPAGIVEIRNLLQRLPAMGTTVLVSSHQLAEVQQACDRLVVLDSGRLIAEGTTAEILELHASRDFVVRLDPTEIEPARAILVAAGLDMPRVAVDEVTVTLPDGWNGRDLNHLLAQAGVYADALTRRTVSLEDAFLMMTAPPPPSGTDLTPTIEKEPVHVAC